MLYIILVILIKLYLYIKVLFPYYFHLIRTEDIKLKFVTFYTFLTLATYVSKLLRR